MDDIKTTHTPAWLALTLAFDSSAKHCDYLRREGWTPAQIGNLIADYIDGDPIDGDPAALSKALEAHLTLKELSRLRSTEVQKGVATALHWSQSDTAHHLLGLDHPDYPAHLCDTANPPPLIYAKGDLKALACPAVAMVGSRKASRQAIELTYRLAEGLAGKGLAIVSGLARGIDAAAHKGALAGGGRTIAVAATHPATVYPKAHASLEQRIIDCGGLVITEYPLGAPTLRWYFPRRNRIISGVSIGVLITEAGLPSGTLTTAAHAADQGREVMAVPGSIHNPQAKGCHSLIKQGAALIECEQDVLDALGLKVQPEPTTAHAKESDSGIIASSQNAPHPEHVDDVETQLLAALAVAPASIDDLMTHTRCNITELSSRLGIMEIEGKIQTCAGGRYVRC